MVRKNKVLNIYSQDTISIDLGVAKTPGHTHPIYTLLCLCIIMGRACDDC